MHRCRRPCSCWFWRRGRLRRRRIFAQLRNRRIGRLALDGQWREFHHRFGGLWGGTPLATNLVSPNQLTASVSASQIASIGTTPVSIQAYSNPSAPISNAVNFTVAPVPPLTLNSVFPSVIAAGGSGLTLTATGLSFAPNAVIRWNGTALTTSPVSSTELRATVPATDVATVGSASISVQNPSGTTVTSAALPVSIQNPVPDAVALQITPDHAGRHQLQFNELSDLQCLERQSRRQPSYALIADGEVLVTVKVGLGSSTGSQLIALDQATGHTVWVPIQLPQGWAFPAYDGGKVFVITSYGIGPGTLQSYTPRREYRLDHYFSPRHCL